ncbi:MAG: hypothetical protein HOV81_03820 [Kofleriaceae bacterium]|nr:hypothetical protein [Kofleriaceae bacterium]
MRFLPSEQFVGILIEDALDEARCAALLANLDRRGFEATGEHYPRDYRNNDRLVFDDDELAASLFELLRDELPAELVVDGARWALCGFNARFRACRYRDGQAFCIHRDGPHVPSDDLRSHLTVQLYLDDAPDREGGRTRFYADPRGTELWATIAPKRGAAIVFDHRAWHDGEAVTAGIKHVLRTDVMYRRLDETGLDHDVVGRHRGYAWRVSSCRDGTLASSGRDGTVRHWGRSARQAMYDLRAGSVTALVEDSRDRLWCGTRNGAVFVIDGDAVTRIADDLGAVLDACASGDRVIVATSRGTLVAYDAALRGAIVEGTAVGPIWASAAHDGWAWSVIAFGDGFASCGEDGRIAITDRRGHTRSFAELGIPLRAVAADGATMIAGDVRGWLHQLDRAGDILASIRAHDGAITCAAIAPDRTWITGSEDGTVKRWRDGREVSARSGDDFITSIAIDARGDIVCSDYSGAIWIAR